MPTTSNPQHSLSISLSPMENSTQNREDVNLLLDVLIHGEEQVRQLEGHLNELGHADECKLLLKQVECTLSKAVAMAKTINCESSDSQRSASGSPRSNDSERAFKENERREMSKKRRTLPKWTSQVCISSGCGTIEGTPDDGYSWRKYGQKDILGAKFPRGYYRCTHRNNHGCLATKQVQRSDVDPSVFDITYCGHHTCARSHRSPPTAAATGPSSQEPDHTNLHRPFTTNLKVETEGLLPSHSSSSSPFSFPSTPVSCSRPGSNLAGSFSPTFISSESNHLALSPLNEIISAANLPIVDIGFMLDHVEFEPNYSFDHSNFFR